MNLKVNGEEVLFTEESLADLINHLKINDEMIAIELNGEIIYEEKYDESLLHDGDRIEIVSFVGGG